ncbi:hypothetical protein JW887_05890 [Candidatus Dojkabacteria bacterium]|nr:hypothetical protein [Candidatus Dojkabacteria bacterium]
MIEYYKAIGFEEVYFVPDKYIQGAEGAFTGKRLYLAASSQEGKNSRIRTETNIHEGGHLGEFRENQRNIPAGVLTLIDLPAQEEMMRMTHQSKGPFADHAKLAAAGILNTALGQKQTMNQEQQHL